MVFTKELPTREEVDVLVAGGGPAGIAAATAAARRGCKTLLVEANGCLGGTATVGALPFYLGMYNGSIPFRMMLEKNLAYKDLPRPRRAVGGIFADLVDRLQKGNASAGACIMGQTETYPGLDRLGCHDEVTFDLEMGKRIIEEMVLEAGAKILYYTQAAEVERVGSEVKGVILSNKDGLTYQPAKAFIDCTGDADVVYRAGLPTYKGDKVTGEMTAASLVAHIENIDAGAIEAYLNNGGDPWFYDACKKAHEAFPEADLPGNLIIFPMVQPGVFMVNGGTAFIDFDCTKAEDLTALTLRGRQRAKVLVENLFRPFMPGAENCSLRLTAYYPGVRETRRIVADYELSEEDVLASRQFPDTIALAGRHFDLSKRHSANFNAQRKLTRRGIVDIPYRSLIPQESTNILAAGRCIAAEGQALGPARIMSTCFAVGEAAGTAASLKLRDHVAFRDINTDELRAILKANDGEVDS